jgi:hypothetical protein
MIVHVVSKRDVPEKQWIIEVTVYLPYGEKVFRVNKIVIDGKEYSAEDEYMKKKLFGLIIEAKKVEMVKEGDNFVAYISTA